ncbi:hypothetical protein Ahy_A10g049816 [Arachis hypogaea]|uniref:SWIM-type domain-containing protein n=1 Tax=Arachis hypogaea TaxID=3818 RepID=A0A445B7Y0_ARAHY|nr:hypothetical protein Ahy_A10g049816 [Arachis hypogaea]
MEELDPFEGWSQGSFLVWLKEGTCDCGLFQSLHFFCRHALVACAVAGVKLGTLCGLSDAVFKVYKVEYPPIPDDKLLPEWYKTCLRLNPAMRRKATDQPVSTRFYNDMDAVEHQEKWCGLYRCLTWQAYWYQFQYSCVGR